MAEVFGLGPYPWERFYTLSSHTLSDRIFYFPQLLFAAREETVPPLLQGGRRHTWRPVCFALQGIMHLREES